MNDAAYRRWPARARGWHARVALLVALWAVLAAAALHRPPAPIDELRYLTVAWEMVSDGDWLVPQLNGAPYAHKPPLLFWLTAAGWQVTGVSAAWPRLLTALCAGMVLLLVSRLARQLWPAQPRVGIGAALALLGMLGFAAEVGAILFDMLLTVGVVLALTGVLATRRSGGLAGPLQVGGGLAIGLLAKGPVALVPVLCVLIARRLWDDPRAVPSRRALAAPWLGVVGGIALALGWALPAAAAGGAAYRQSLLLGQTADRLVFSFAHARPWWWYGPILLALAFPYALDLSSWRRIATAAGDRATRFVLAWVGGSVVVLSLVSGKQPHYLLPALPGLALLIGRTANDEGAPGSVPSTPRGFGLPIAVVVAAGVGLLALPLLRSHALPAGWSFSPPALVVAATVVMVTAAGAAHLRRRWGVLGLSLLTPGLLLAVAIAGERVAHGAYDIAPVAARVAAIARQGGEVAFAGRYHGELGYAARLRRPVDEIAPPQAPAWLAAHPRGVVVGLVEADLVGCLPAPDLVASYRSKQLAVWSGSAVRGDDRVARSRRDGEPASSG